MADEAKKKGSFFGRIGKFFKDVKVELKKVTWPTKKEVVPSCAMVVTLVAIATVFFFIVDAVLAWGVDKILMLG